MIKCSVDNIVVKGSRRTVGGEFNLILKTYIENVLMPVYKDKKKVEDLLIATVEQIFKESKND